MRKPLRGVGGGTPAPPSGRTWYQLMSLAHSGILQEASKKQFSISFVPAFYKQNLKCDNHSDQL